MRTASIVPKRSIVSSRLYRKATLGLVMGNRMNDLSRMPRLRRIVNRYMSKKISRLCGQEIPDTQCGFRMLHRRLIPELLGGAARFDYETEMLIVASRKGFRIDSVRSARFIPTKSAASIPFGTPCVFSN